MPVILETYHEFRERHPGEPIPLPDGVWLFSDGARYPMGEQPGRGVEPPSDPWQRLRLQRQYVQREYDREQRERDKFRADCMSAASIAARNVGGSLDGMYNPPPDAVDQLRRGAERIEKLRQQLADIDAELAKSPEAVAWAQRRADDEQKRARLSAFYNEVAGA